MKAAKSARVGLGIATDVGRKPGGGRPGKIGGGCEFMPGTARADRRSEVFARPKNPFPLPNCLWRSTGDSPPRTRDMVRGVMRVSVTLWRRFFGVTTRLRASSCSPEGRPPSSKSSSWLRPRGEGEEPPKGEALSELFRSLMWSMELGAARSVGRRGKGEVEVEEAIELVTLGASMVLEMERGAVPGTRGVDLSRT